jgi:hypothetical protein
VGGTELNFGAAGSIGIEEAKSIWTNALPRRMNH